MRRTLNQIKCSSSRRNRIPTFSNISSVHESRRHCSQYKTYIVLLKCNKTTIPQRLFTRRREQIVLHTIQQNESETNTSLLGTAHNIIIPIRLLKANI